MAVTSVAVKASTSVTLDLVWRQTFYLRATGTGLIGFNLYLGSMFTGSLFEETITNILSDNVVIIPNP